MTAAARRRAWPGQTLASYSYNGVGRLVIESFPTPAVMLDYFGGTSGTYAGFDRFGRVADQHWSSAGVTPATLDRYQYGYDYNSNRTYRKNVLSTTVAKDWAYTYDGLNRLKAADRGRLADPPTAGLLSNTKNRRQDWALDRLGNWDAFKEGGGSAWTLEQARTHNKVNEITDITETTGSAWVTPAHDARGNMTSGPKPGAETTKLHFVYDAWNRLVQVKADNGGSPGDIIATYCYDAAGRRIRKLLGTNPASPDTSYDYYFNNLWQILEVRKDGAAISNLYEQYVWSERYIDSPVLRDRDADGQSHNGLEERLYYTTDANMNVTALVDASGSVVERYEYDSYGKVTILSVDFTGTRDSSLYANEVLYCGYRYDPETGLYQVRMRYYHPTLGRWLTRDADYYDGLNLYEYVGSGPIIRRDSFGLTCGTCSPVTSIPQRTQVGVLMLPPGKTEKDLESAGSLIKTIQLVGAFQNITSFSSSLTIIGASDAITSSSGLPPAVQDAIKKVIARTGLVDIYMRVKWYTCDPCCMWLLGKVMGEQKWDEVVVKCSGQHDGMFELTDLGSNPTQKIMKECAQKALEKAYKKWTGK